jgi:uncharacterized protein YndB with AHSA1/START domain
MPSAHNEIVINRPVEAVFGFVADGTTAPQWRPAVLDVAHLSGAGIGARYRQGVKGPGGRRIAADYEVTGYEPNRALAFAATAGPVRPTGTYAFEAVPEGTRVTFTLGVTLGGWRRLLLSGPVQATMDAEVANLTNLKRVMEATSQSG